MAYQMQPLTPLAREEIKEINREEYSDLSQAEVFRLRAENRELISNLEKLNEKLSKKKNELDMERTNSNTFRQLIQELNTKVQLLESAALPPSPVSPSIQSLQNIAMHPVSGEACVGRLESKVCEQRREIEFLNSELISYKNKLQTESAINREAGQVRIELLLRDKQLEECEYKYLKLEAECQLGKQLYQEAINSLSAEKEQLLRRETGPDRLRLSRELDSANDQIVKLKQTSIANEEQLKLKIQQLRSWNMDLENNMNNLNKQIAEQNKQIGALEQTQLDREKSQTLTEIKDKQISDLKLQILDLFTPENEVSHQTQVDEQIKELNLQNKSQVAQTTTIPLIPANTPKWKYDKKLSRLSNDLSRDKQTESSGAGATPNTTNTDLAPQLVQMPIKLAGIQKISLRPGRTVRVVKLKHLPDPLQYRDKQVIQSVNKRYELGVLKVILEVPGKVGFKNQKYVGINLCTPAGNCSGEFRAKRYFECEPNCGIFVPFEEVLVPVA